MKKNELYCVRCRAAVAPRQVKLEKDKNGRHRIKGKCPHCSTLCYKYVAVR